jgi:hypothetical protein
MGIESRLARLEKLAGPLGPKPIVAVFFDKGFKTPLWFFRECGDLEDWPAGLRLEDLPRTVKIYAGIDPHVVSGDRTEIDPRC